MKRNMGDEACDTETCESKCDNCSSTSCEWKQNNSNRKINVRTPNKQQELKDIVGIDKLK